MEINRICHLLNEINRFLEERRTCTWRSEEKRKEREGRFYVENLKKEREEYTFGSRGCSIEWDS